MKKIVIAVAGVFFISGCATTEQRGNKGENAATGAAVGALAGCGIAMALGKSCAGGAVLGGVAGAAIGWSHESKKVETAEVANTHARQAGVNVPMDKIILRSYDVTSNTNTVRQGGNIVTGSTIQLIGRSNTPPKVEETLVLITPDGKIGKPQVAKVASVDGAGEYKATAKFSIPQSFPQGKYMVKTQLSLDDKPQANSSFNVQVVYIDGHQNIRIASLD